MASFPVTEGLLANCQTRLEVELEKQGWEFSGFT